MQSFIFPLLFIIGITYLNMVVFKKQFANVLPVAIMESLVVLFCTGFFNLTVGYYICIGFSTIGWILIPVNLYLSNRTGRNRIRFNFEYEICLFLVLYLILFILNFRKGFYKWDDFSHWGVMAKETLRLNRFYYVPESVVSTHKDYPPLSALLQYLWCRLGGGYSESAIFNCKHLFCFSLLFPVLNGLKLRWADKWYKNIVSILCSAAIFITATSFINIGEAFFFRTIYPECVLSLLVFYGFYLIYADNEHSFYYSVQIVLMGICLLMTKQIAFYFWGILIVYDALKRICSKEKWDRRQILTIACTVIIPFCTWNAYRVMANQYAPSRQFNGSKFSLKNIIRVFTGNGEPYQKVTFQNYFNKIIENPLQNRPLPLSYIQIMGVCILFLILLYYLKKEEHTRRKLILLGAVQIIAMTGYIGVMLISYLFGFSVSEATIVTCFGRYMLTLLYPIMLLNGILLAMTIYNKKNITQIQFLMGILFVTTVVLYPPELMVTELKPGVLCEDKTAAFEGDAELIKQYTDEHAKIYLICQEDNESIWNMIAYETVPRSYQYKGYSLGKPYSEDDEFTEDISVEEWKKRLSKFDYLYLSNVDEQFISTYGKAFPNDQIRNQQLYEIINHNGTIKLKLVIEKEW